MMMFAVLTGCTVIGRAPYDESAVARAFPDWERAILEDPDKFEFLTLYPYWSKHEGDEELKLLGSFNGWGVLGRARVTDKALQQVLVSQLFDAIAYSKPGGVNCFNPRHAIHVERDGKHVDVLVCFHCANVYVYPEGEQNSIELELDCLDEWRAAPKKLDLVVQRDNPKK